MKSADSAPPRRKRGAEPESTKSSTLKMYCNETLRLGGNTRIIINSAVGKGSHGYIALYRYMEQVDTFSRWQ